MIITAGNNNLLMLLIVSVLFCSQSYAQHTATADLETLKDRFTAELLEPEVQEDEIEQLTNTIREDGTWPGINYKDTSRTVFEHSQHLSNMVKLSRAYKKQSSSYYQNPDVKQTLNDALNFWLEHDFICENWWWNQIGTPEHMVHVLMIMDDELTEAQVAKAAPIVGRANLDAWGARPGGDLIKIAGILGKYGIFKRDMDVVDEALEAIVGEIGYAIDRNDPSDVRGLQTDLSFHHRHDRVTSTLSYGLGYAAAFADWSAKVAGTKFRFPDDALELLVDFYLDGICQTMVYGKYPDPGAKNRSITRRGTLNPKSSALPEKLLQATSYRQEELEEIVAIRKGEREPNLTSSKFFWHSEYFSHQRPGYFTSVRMYSSRNHNMEVPYNSEGLKNHFYAEGANFISRTGEEYQQIFPVWDWQKVPGTTVAQRPSYPPVEEIQKQGSTDFVGGVSDGQYGAAAFDYESPHDPLLARKSWFFFDKEYVALGAGITSDSEYPVATTLNQCLLNGDVVVGKDSNSSILDRGEHELEDVSWIYHDKIAYLLPDNLTTVHLENKERSGYWHEINNQSWARGLDEEHKDVFSLWLDHGVNPEQAGYKYIVIPGIEAADVEQYRSDSPIDILANTDRLQAVRHKALDISQLVFYEPGEIEIADGITVSIDAPGLVMVKTSGQTIKEITVSDLSRQKDSLRLQVTSRIEGQGEGWTATWDEKEGYSSISLELPTDEFAGQSISVVIPGNS